MFEPGQSTPPLENSGDSIMKRSEINAIMYSANEFLQEQKFYLPPFAYWTPEDWQKKGPEAAEIVETQLGWDITDFGAGDFAACGLFLFTIRNGKPKNLVEGTGKLYAEKILIVDVDQVTPMHFHWSKMEDIINRGGGSLMVQLYNATPDEDLDRQAPVRVSIDSIFRTVPAGEVVELKPGESITLTRGMYHKFWAEGARALIGEVSLVNDDSADNRFFEAQGRFPVIEEDEQPLHLLVGDYPRYYGLD
jgi:D-lyxose ketol-isomerase